GVCQSNSDSFLLAQIGHRQLMLLPSKMLICAAREALVVTVEMINDYRVSEKQLGRTGTADETDHGNQQRYREPLNRVAIGPCVFLMSAAKDQSKVNDDDGDVRRAAASTLVASDHAPSRLEAGAR